MYIFLIWCNFSYLSDENKLPLLAPKRRDESSSGDASDTNQCIIALDMETWQELVDVFEIKEAMIPPSARDKRPLPN